MVGGAICLTASSYVALVLLTERGKESANESAVLLPPAAKDVIGVLVLIGNLGCMLWGAYEFLLAMDWQRIVAAVQDSRKSLQAASAAAWRRLRLCMAAMRKRAQ
jgi:hypothetical protein